MTSLFYVGAKAARHLIRTASDTIHVMEGDEHIDSAIRLQTILEALDDAVVMTDLDGIITFWNPAAEGLYGYTQSEIIGRSMMMLCPPRRLEEEQHLLTRVTNGERIRDVDAVRVSRDGSEGPIGLTLVPIRQASGDVVGVLRIAHDVSGRYAAERAARRLAAIVESSDDAIVGKDLNGIVTSWNQAAERLFGYPAHEMIGQSIRRLIPADRQAEEDTVLSCIRRGEKVDHFETIRVHKSGRLLPISLTVSPILDAAGRIVGASKTARDITYRLHAEAERARLLALAEQNAAITDTLNRVGAVVASGLDRTKIVQAVIDSGTEVTTSEFGVFSYKAVGENGQESTFHSYSGELGGIPEDTPMPIDAAMFEAPHARTGVVRSADITKDLWAGRQPEAGDSAARTHVIRSYLAVPVRSRSGEVMGGLFFGHSDGNVFDERHERLALGVASWASVALENARLYAEVQQASRLKDEFLATLSHELRTPLNAILGYARMLCSGIVPRDNHMKAVATIERNAKSLTQIVEDVLDVSRIISGKLRLNLQPIKLTDLVTDAIDVVTPSADAKGVLLDATLDPDVERVAGDPERLQQIVWNLLSNALKFTPRGGAVHVGLHQAGAQVEIVVADTGVGIPGEFLPHIFERFRQADSSSTRERGGLGLGLAIVRQLVEMHGGTIEAASDGPGRGATFRVRLPAMAARVAAGARGFKPRAEFDSAQWSRPDLRGVRVLVVDDDRDALDMVREILEATGAEVVVADSAMTAIEAVHAVSPDVLISDLGMPRMDGFELIARIRQSSDPAIRNLPAAALTAYARSDDRLKAINSGFQLHLAKPLDPGELMAVVAALTKPSKSRARGAPPRG